MDEHEIASWWTPSGWVRQPVPASYLAARTSGEIGTVKSLLAAGYVELIDHGDGEDMRCAYEVAIFGYGAEPNAHIYVVVMGNMGCSVADFFVERGFEAAFVVEKLPALLRGTRP